MKRQVHYWELLPPVLYNAKGGAVVSGTLRFMSFSSVMIQFLCVCVFLPVVFSSFFSNKLPRF